MTVDGSVRAHDAPDNILTRDRSGLAETYRVITRDDSQRSARN